MATGRGVSLGKTVLAGLLGVSAIAGLSIGISVQSQDASRLNSRINDLRSEIDTVNKITEDINVTPPKGFINAR